MPKALIVDDDRIVLESLQALLEDVPGLDVCGTALSAAEALDLIDLHQPDLLFLDVHMPGMDGFEMVEQLPYRIDIIFVTTSEAHAVRAFELNALDYLLKPVEPERLNVAVQRVLARPRDIGAQPPEYEHSGESIQHQDYIYLPMACSQRFIRAEDVQRVSSHRNNSRVVMTDGRVFEIRRSLNEWEQRLGDEHFYRINREVIMSIHQIKEVVRASGEAWCVDRQGERYPVSRRRVSGLRALLAGNPEL